MNAGFTTGTPWIGVNLNYRTVNATRAVDDPDSVWHHFRRVIELRHREPAPRAWQARIYRAAPNPDGVNR